MALKFLGTTLAAYANNLSNPAVVKLLQELIEGVICVAPGITLALWHVCMTAALMCRFKTRHCTYTTTIGPKFALFLVSNKTFTRLIPR